MRPVPTLSPVLVLALAGSASGQAFFPAELELSSLDGTTGFVMSGIDALDQSGQSVSSAGDVNGDGIDDLIIGAFGADPNGVGGAGESYVVFGRATGFSTSMDLSSLDGTSGFIINGIDREDFSGFSVSAAGDVNGDGIDDLIIGAPGGEPNGNSNAGESYVVFGHMGGFPTSLELSALDGTNGFVLNGTDAYDNSALSVSCAGDFDGDGLDDLIIGAPGGDPNGSSAAGESFIVFGRMTPFNASMELSSLNGTTGFVINGVDASDNSGGSVSAAGDVNGDGFSDVIIGAPLADPNGVDRAGESYVVFGGPGVGAGGSFELSSLNGTNGFVINGINAVDFSGESVSGAGDVNGDGLDDVIIGSFRADPYGNTYAGESYVVFGSSTGFPASLDLSSLNGINGFVLHGRNPYDRSGGAVSSAGDVNGDGIDDLLIGAKYADPNGLDRAGESYVVFGRTGAFPASIGPSSLDGTNGLVLSGVDTYDASGSSVSSAGDVNGDGIDDIIIGATGADPNGNSAAGESYVVFGRRCLADTNHDGMLTPADFTAWIAAFNAMASECDQNGDGNCDASDFTAWIANFNAGCG
ncbi:MAG TPA: hypothetical protein ENJ00_01495 [Phycisphaerales bacterium]|nr:hypothetical protein [Phycisphaerales bacterium]